jgi:hypothetical protein
MRARVAIQTCAVPASTNRPEACSSPRQSAWRSARSLRCAASGARRRALVAAPDYLARAGRPQIPTFRPTCPHELIVGPVSGQNNGTFRKGSSTTSVRTEGRLRIDGNEGAIATAVAGTGIIMTSSAVLVVVRSKAARSSTVWKLGIWAHLTFTPCLSAVGRPNAQLALLPTI